MLSFRTIRTHLQVDTASWATRQRVDIRQRSVAPLKGLSLKRLIRFRPSLSPSFILLDLLRCLSLSLSSLSLSFSASLSGTHSCVLFSHCLSPSLMASPCPFAAACEVTELTCTGCSACGKHLNPHFNLSASATGQWVRCGADCPGKCQKDGRMCVSAQRWAE